MNNVIQGYLSSSDPATAPTERLQPLTALDRARIAADTDAALRDVIAEDALAPATRRSYASALRYWADWHVAAFGTRLALLDRQPVPADAVAAFLAHHLPASDEPEAAPRAGMPAIVRERLDALVSPHRRRSARTGGDPHLVALATLRHRLSTLQAMHRILGLPVTWPDDPRVRLALRAAPRRVARVAPALLRTPKAPLLREDVMRMLDTCADDGPVGLRDAALLWLAFGTGGRRRSELVGLRWEHLRPATEGAIWHMPEAKGRVATTSEGVMRLPVVGRPWAALLRWRAEVLRQAPALAERGPVFRRLLADGTLLDEPITGHDVWRIVRQRAASVGLDPETVGAHSLRAGAATSFLLEGGPLADASAMLGHRRLDTTRQHYDRRGVAVESIRRLAE